MNTFEFVIRRLLRSLGVVNERNHLHIASQQSQYLNEAEDMLGRIAWKDVADVPELSEGIESFCGGRTVVDPQIRR